MDMDSKLNAELGTNQNRGTIKSITNDNGMNSIYSEGAFSAILVENSKAQGSIASIDLKLIAEDSLMDSDGDRTDVSKDSESNPSLILESKSNNYASDEAPDEARTVTYSNVDDVSMISEDNRIVKDNDDAPVFT
ncbi:hypothetical protein L1887_32326 [Cichorium endivia]|nr:hypothetical protein L1887_40562 [Cichorium endivia]KAI3503870.1 hypothetical protein L1887_32326 [Cichorium endivia]